MYVCMYVISTTSSCTSMHFWIEGPTHTRTHGHSCSVTLIGRSTSTYSFKIWFPSRRNIWLLQYNPPPEPDSP